MKNSTWKNLKNLKKKKENDSEKGNRISIWIGKMRVCRCQWTEWRFVVYYWRERKEMMTVVACTRSSWRVESPWERPTTIVRLRKWQWWVGIRWILNRNGPFGRMTVTRIIIIAQGERLGAREFQLLSKKLDELVKFRWYGTRVHFLDEVSLNVELISHWRGLSCVQRWSRK